MDELLVKYMLGEADAEEAGKVQTWLEENEGNRRYFNQMQQVWLQSRQVAPGPDVDVEAAWQRFRQRRDRVEQPHAAPLRPRRILRMAAALVALLASAALIYFALGNSATTFEAGSNTLACDLPDGSKVLLNKNAVLSYKVSEGVRKAKLSGEAFFEVAPDKAHPFVITASDKVTVTVVGTAFNVKTDEGKTEVNVESGLVNVMSNNTKVLLAKNERAVVAGKNGKPVKSQSLGSLYNYYRAKDIVCDGTPLADVAAMLSHAYNMDIAVADAATGKLRLHTTIPAGAAPGTVIDMLAATFNLSVEETEGKVLLRAR